MNLRDLWRHLSFICIALGFILPLAVWIPSSVHDIREADLSVELLIPLLKRTHSLALAVASFSVIAAAPAALYSRLARPYTAFCVAVLLIAPLSVGMLARNYSWVGMLSANDGITSLGWSLLGGKDLLYTPTAVNLVMTFVFAPWAFFMLRLALGGITDIQIEAAATLGASPSRLVGRVLGPALLRGALLAGLLIYGSALGYFITPKMLGGNSGDLAGNAILRFMELGDFAAASTISLALLTTAIPFGLILWLIQHRYRLGD